MRSAFTKVGFEWIPGTPDVNKLQPGDVVLNEGPHTEMYIGNGKLIGAHGNSDGRDGDSSGNEISITNYSNKNWDGVLRYVGTGTAEQSSTPVTVPTAPRIKLDASTTSTTATDSTSQDSNSSNDTKEENKENNNDLSNDESRETVAV